MLQQQKILPGYFFCCEKIHVCVCIDMHSLKSLQLWRTKIAAKSFLPSRQAITFAVVFRSPCSAGSTAFCLPCPQPYAPNAAGSSCPSHAACHCRPGSSLAVKEMGFVSPE